MRRLLLLLLLAGCDRQPEVGADQGNVASSPQAPAAQPSVRAGADQNRQRAEQALKAILPKPQAARYSEIRSGAAGSVCGYVDTGEAGGARPFVVTPEGVGVISATPQVMFDDPEDVFPDYYIRWCASPEELRRVGPRVLTGPLPELPPIEEYPLIPEEAPPEPAPAEKAKSPPPATPPATEDDSFSRAVLRKRGE